LENQRSCTLVALAALLAPSAPGTVDALLAADELPMKGVLETDMVRVSGR
jgi:hypothetical protein